ncbi:MAG: hypothetical protein OXT74_11890 [Candidatus Poribacteria bacterium]|nr:hypothetical protein [Candidatus Poribacteria bacterium]
MESQESKIREVYLLFRRYIPCTNNLPIASAYALQGRCPVSGRDILLLMSHVLEDYCGEHLDAKFSQVSQWLLWEGHTHISDY